MSAQDGMHAAQFSLTVTHSLQGLKKQLKEHWLRVRTQHSKRARLKINRFRSRLVALLQSTQPALALPPGMNGTLSLSDIPQEQQWA